MTTILLDVDGVIADCNQAVWRAARKMFNRKLPHYSTSRAKSVVKGCY